MYRRRPLAAYGSNIKFLAKYLFDNPGATSGECRKALCENNGVEWTTSTDMRGQYTTYFNSGYIGGSSWPNNPCGRYWKRFKREDGKSGYLLTLEGLCKVQMFNWIWYKSPVFSKLDEEFKAVLIFLGWEFLLVLMVVAVYTLHIQGKWKVKKLTGLQITVDVNRLVS